MKEIWIVDLVDQEPHYAASSVKAYDICFNYLSENYGLDEVVKLRTSFLENSKGEFNCDNLCRVTKAVLER